MLPIKELLICLQSSMSNANLKIFSSLVESFLCVRHQVTTRGLSRYSSYSLRQIFRFLATPHNWLEMRMQLLRAGISPTGGDVHIVAGDETVEGKAGKHTYGLGEFYSSCAQKPIAGVNFFAMNLINTVTKSSYLLHVKQVVATEEEKERTAEKKQKIKEGKQRTKEGKNLPRGAKKKVVTPAEDDNKEALEATTATVKEQNSKPKKEEKQEKESLSSAFRVFKELFTETMDQLKIALPQLKVTHLVADSAYASLSYLRIAEKKNLYFISKLRETTCLYLTKVEKKEKISYEDKLDISAIEDKYLKKIEIKEGKTYKTYQLTSYNSSLAWIPLNIVILIVEDKEKRVSTNVWFSNDMNITFETLLYYYQLRFQIEYHFRDAKQHFGLSDFKNYKQENLTNFVNLSFTMCLISEIVLQKYRQKHEGIKMSILDLKIIASTQHAARRIINYLGIKSVSNSYENAINDYLPEDLINRKAA
jgi:putative transposase